MEGLEGFLATPEGQNIANEVVGLIVDAGLEVGAGNADDPGSSGSDTSEEPRETWVSLD